MNNNFENIGWSVGNYCNAECNHCYSWKVRRNSNEFLSKSDINIIIKQLKKLNVKTVNLGGNEPIYTHGNDLKKTLLPYIIKELHNNNIPVGLTTNGFTFYYLYRYYPNELKLLNDIDFSLDSPFEEEHNKNRNINIYRMVCDSISKSIKIGIDCSIITCGMKSNFNLTYLNDFLNLTKLLNTEFRINTLKPTEKTMIDNIPTPKQFFEGFKYLIENTDCVTLGESCLTAITNSGSKGCPCGITSFRINAKDADGKISINPCVYAHDFKVGNLLEDDIFDIINSDEFKLFSSRNKYLPKECKDANCEYIEVCRGGCTARTWLVYHDLDRKDPYCPKDYFTTNKNLLNSFPKNFNVGEDNKLRVHDNYLCTWIGKVNENFKPNRTLKFYLKNNSIKKDKL